MLIAAVSEAWSVIIAAVIAAAASGSVVWFQQKNRRQDRIDKTILANTTYQVQETQAALKAWREIVQTNTATINAQAAQIDSLQRDGKQLTEENLALKLELGLTKLELHETRIEVTKLKAQVATLENHNGG